MIVETGALRKADGLNPFTISQTAITISCVPSGISKYKPNAGFHVKEMQQGVRQVENTPIKPQMDNQRGISRVR